MTRRSSGGARQLDTPVKLRCAIYTRKSTEEGLDQEFNSLDAQREACAAYILSQRQEGWQLVPTHYDDGGFSGGNMNRPSLQRLLADIRSGKVDVIVVYKVDRLTRSLADFAKIVEALDGAGASFVSITQAFNTTTSMGRLTLNVLLSFAQFEREVISERVRDKVAASKAKGMWMGGTVPLGYEAKDRKLIVNASEAETVRHIMSRYLELGSVRELMVDLRAAGIVTKRQTMRDGSTRGGVPFARGPLYHFLKNRLYVGKIPHHDKTYPGEHEAIVDRELFEAVQSLLAKNTVDRRTGSRSSHPSLLAGMIRDAQDRPLTPSHASKGKTRYRYYVSNEAVPGEGDGSGVVRLPALPVERSVVCATVEMLRNAEPIRKWCGSRSGETIRIGMSRFEALATRLARASAPDARALLIELDLQIAIDADRILGSCSLDRLLSAAGVERDQADGAERVSIPLPTKFKLRGHELRLVVEPAAYANQKRCPRWISFLARGHEAKAKLAKLDRQAGSAAAIDRAELNRIARFAYLAPDIASAILDGRHPLDLSARQLKRMGELPLCWRKQRELLGAPS